MDIGVSKESSVFTHTFTAVCSAVHRLNTELSFFHPFTPTSAFATTMQSQKGSRSKHDEQEVSSSWAGAEDLKKVEEELDANMDPSGGSSRWKPSAPSSSSQGPGQYEEGGQKTAALSQMSQTGSWRRGMTAQVGITPPRSKGATAGLKTPGEIWTSGSKQNC